MVLQGCANYSFHWTNVCNYSVTLKLVSNAVIYNKTITVQLLYMAVFNFESGNPLLLLREIHLPS